MKVFLILSLAMLMMYSCGGTSKTETVATTVEEVTSHDGHSARNSLDYQGVYRGVLPAADAEGMEVIIILADSTYSKSVSYIGKMSIAMVEEGKYVWNEAGNTITLENLEAPNQYFVAENKLLHLDIEGKKIEGELADKYILAKDLDSE